MRMYGTLRRQEITLLLIFTGALLAAVVQFEEFAEYFCTFGIIISLFFLFMMKRMTDYYYISRKRAIQIEKLLGMEQFQFLEKELEGVQLSQFTSTRATYSVCITTVLLWACILVVELYHLMM
jgi:purine-cytosine permease-like protein